MICRPEEEEDTAGVGAVVQSWAKANLGRYLSPEELKTVLMQNGTSVLDLKSGLTTTAVSIQKAIVALGGDPDANPDSPPDSGGGDGPTGWPGLLR